MNNIPLSDAARKVLDQAQDEARALNQEFVGTEHLVLALANVADTNALRLLEQHSVDRAALRSQILTMLPKGDDAPGVTGDLPLSPKAQRAVQSALVMSRSLREPKLSTRVLLISLLDEPKTAIADAMRAAGVDLDQLLRALAEKPEHPEM